MQIKKHLFRGFCLVALVINIFMAVHFCSFLEFENYFYERIMWNAFSLAAFFPLLIGIMMIVDFMIDLKSYLGAFNAD